MIGRPSSYTTSQYQAVHIYALHCPDTGQIRYIGKANDAWRRYKSHIRDSRRRNTPVYRWIRKLALDNKKPKMSVLLSCCKNGWQECEKLIISSYKQSGIQLLNVAEGGDEPYCDDTVRSSNANKMNARLKSDPQLARMRYLKAVLGISIKSGSINDRTKDKLRAAAIRHPLLLGEYATL